MCYNVMKRQKGHIYPGDTFKTKAGKLGAKYLINAVIPDWNCEDKQTCVRLLECIVHQCLQKVTHMNLTSIAFPPLGCGDWKFPETVTMETIVEAVYSYLTNEDSCVKTVYLHTLNQTHKDMIQNVLKSKIPEGKPCFVSKFWGFFWSL